MQSHALMKNNCNYFFSVSVYFLDKGEILDTCCGEKCVFIGVL